VQATQQGKGRTRALGLGARPARPTARRVLPFGGAHPSGATPSALLNITLTVRRSIHRVRGGLIYDEPKTRRSRRTLALPMPLVAELHRHKAAQLGERMPAGSEWQDEDLVLPQSNGRPIDKKIDYDE
jgi:hypothetical protein